MGTSQQEQCQMDDLERIFRASFEDALSFKKIGTKLIARQLAKQGITLCQEQLEKIESRLEDIEGDSLATSIDDLVLEDDSQDNLVIQLDNLDDMDGIVNEITEKIIDAIPDIISETSSILLDQLKRNVTKILEEHQADREAFESRLFQKWETALNLLEMLRFIAFEAGAKFNNKFRPKAAEENNLVFEALTRLHARACQVALEVLALLRSGFADGAHARWRTLHEIAVVASFIQQSGNEVAERYLLHNHIESYKAAQQYQNYFVRLRQDAIPEQELADLRSIYQQLINRFGSAYRNSYGWAAVALGRQDPKFSDIEQVVGLDHLRPYYKLASHNVHANPKGMLFRLGLYPERTNLLLAGPSDAGLADPGHGAAISLFQTTTTLLTTEANIDRLVICHVMVKLVDEIGDAFLAGHEKPD
jgi:Family of unknown function (DUF5677)